MRGEGVIVKLQLVASWFIENCVFALAKSNFAVTIAGVSTFLLVVVFLNTKHDAIGYSTGCIISAQLFHVSVSGQLDQKHQKGIKMWKV